MGYLASDLKNIFTIKFKQREDDFFDQYSRLIMLKILLVCSFVCGLSWYNDKFNCSISDKLTAPNKNLPTFIGDACWIRGIYIYRNISNGNFDISYYGLPIYIELDGTLTGTNTPCSTTSRLKGKTTSKTCNKLSKTFFFQYQYIPFLLVSVALLYYLPYFLFKLFNNDMVKLNSKLQDEKSKAPEIFKLFFRKKWNRNGRLILSDFRFLLLKICYIAANVTAFVIFDWVLYGKYIVFGKKWIEWYRQPNNKKFAYERSKELIKPANELLPPIGYCDITTSSKQVHQTSVDRIQVICEVSTHIVYQYAFLLLWFLIVLGIVISCIGLIVELIRIGFGFLNFGEKDHELREAFRHLTNREKQYLRVINERNIVMYGEIIKLLVYSLYRSKKLPTKPNQREKQITLNTPTFIDHSDKHERIPERMQLHDDKVLPRQKDPVIRKRPTGHPTGPGNTKRSDKYTNQGKGGIDKSTPYQTAPERKTITFDESDEETVSWDDSFQMADINSHMAKAVNVPIITP